MDRLGIRARDYLAILLSELDNDSDTLHLQSFEPFSRLLRTAVLLFVGGEHTNLLIRKQVKPATAGCSWANRIPLACSPSLNELGSR